ncbi:MFS transporter [Chamaesiphon minutus]|uniref:Arabinose efflux permease family protein n=1 Tax=Chamaesiphon minutus (strain ATCC 27169 / PCC 6605) TaxID=1173020 RepID=K9U9E5_CHAP6|nr:MFS transporter [Chamaesiphon minutus]AFY91445.1 arabinose efflux permease family protein [Chamaesiphon minutus PCC 6605]
MKKISFGTSLRNPIFRQLYLAQTISLLGDALTWLGLALLAFELADKAAPIVLAGALTLRVTAFTLLSPVAGVVADRVDRKPILIITHLGRMLLVCLLPFVNSIWQIYALVLGLNIFNAFFSPTYQATIPLVTDASDYPQAIALSSMTYQILGVFGPGIAGILALFIGARDLFLWDGLSFIIAAILIGTLPENLRTDAAAAGNCSIRQIRSDIQVGTLRLWTDAPIRYGLLLQLVASIAGAQILVNTVNYVQGKLGHTAVAYGWVMMGFGLGATLGTIAIGILPQYRSKILTLLGGGILINVALLGADNVELAPLILLWAIAGCGQSLINLSMQTLIADRTPTDLQGRVYGAHFAWSHLWWAGAYPLAGWLGTTFGDRTFLYGSLIGLALLTVVHFSLAPDRFAHTHAEIWHTHPHHHDFHHKHKHEQVIEVSTVDRSTHLHPHAHSQVSHVHVYTDISHEHF